MSICVQSVQARRSRQQAPAPQPLPQPLPQQTPSQSTASWISMTGTASTPARRRSRPRRSRSCAGRSRTGPSWRGRGGRRASSTATPNRGNRRGGTMSRRPLIQSHRQEVRAMIAVTRLWIRKGLLWSQEHWPCVYQSAQRPNYRSCEVR